MKWNFYDDFYTIAGLSYSRGKAENNGIKTPINSIQPMKTKLGLVMKENLLGLLSNGHTVEVNQIKILNNHLLIYTTQQVDILYLI